METNDVTIFLPLIIISGAIAVIWGSKKRIGFGWSFVFLCLWILPGVLAIILSPPLKKLPPDNPKDKMPNMFFGVLGGFIGLYILIRYLTTPSYISALKGREGSMLYNILTSAGLLAFSYYMFTRSKRNQELYAKSNQSQN